MNTGDKRGFVPKWMDWKRDVASGGGVRHTVEIIKKSEQRSNGKRTEDRTCEAIRNEKQRGDQELYSAMHRKLKWGTVV